MHIQDKALVDALSGQLGDVTLQAAVYARIETAASPARWLGPLGNYLIVRPAARAAAGKATERTDLPLDAAVVLGIGGGEMHVWKADPLRSDVSDHLGSLALDRITGMRSEPGKHWSSLVIEFGADERLELDARGDVRGLVEAWEGTQRASA